MRCVWVETELARVMDGLEHSLTCESVVAHLAHCHSCRQAALDLMLVHRQIQAAKRTLPAEAFDAFIRFLVWTGEPVIGKRHD